MKHLIPFAICLTTLAAQPQSDLENIREAVFRHMFLRNASGLQQRAGVYCLSIGGADPTDAFIARFSKHQPPVKKESDCVMSDQHGVVDKTTNARGLIFRITKVNHVGDANADVEGGYYEGNVSASGNIYSLEKRAGVWKVVKDVMLWIS